MAKLLRQKEQQGKLLEDSGHIYVDCLRYSLYDKALELLHAVGEGKEISLLADISSIVDYLKADRNHIIGEMKTHKDKKFGTYSEYRAMVSIDQKPERDVRK